MATRFVVDTSSLSREKANELYEKLNKFAFIVNFALNSSRDIISLDVVWDNNDSIESIVKAMGIPASCPITIPQD